MRYNNTCWVCLDSIVVSTLRFVRNNPGSKPGFGKYFILYSVMPLINLHTTRIMRASKETYCFPLFHAGITIGDLFIFCFRFGVKTDVGNLTCGRFYASLCKNIPLPYMDEV